jgi:hypothetical protein
MTTELLAVAIQQRAALVVALADADVSDRPFADVLAEIRSSPEILAADAVIAKAKEADLIAFEVARNADKNADGPARRNQAQALALQIKANREFSI